jgi:hypothetical protein
MIVRYVVIVVVGVDDLDRFEIPSISKGILGALSGHHHAP